MRYTLILFTFSVFISCVFAVLNGGGATASSPQNIQSGSSAPQNGAGNTLEQMSPVDFAKEFCQNHNHNGTATKLFCKVLCRTGPKTVKTYVVPDGTTCGKNSLCKDGLCHKNIKAPSTQ